MYHLYLSISPSEDALRREREALLAWCEENEVGEYNVIAEQPRTDRFSARVSSKMLAPIQRGDTVVITQFERLGRSLKMLCEVLASIIGRGASLYVISEGILYEPESPQTIGLLEKVRFADALDRRIKTQRSSEGISRNPDSSAHRGRPFGSRKSASKNVLYGKEARLLEMKAQGESISAIARELGVSRGTLYNYFKALEWTS